jgi:hypothetical protein
MIGPGFLLDDELRYRCRQCGRLLTIVCTPLSDADRRLPPSGCVCGSGENRFDAVDAYLQFRKSPTIGLDEPTWPQDGEL